MKVVLINLDKSKDRLTNMQRQFDVLNIPFQRFSAVNGKELSTEELEKTTSKMCSNVLCNRGMIGCALSHMRIIKDFVQSKDDFICIMEDDVVLTKDFPKFLTDVDKVYEKLDFDMISLFCLGICKVQTVAVNNYTFSKPLFPLSLTSYILSKKGAMKFLDYIGDKILYHIDFSLAVSIMDKSFKYFVLIHPQIISLKNTASTMGSNSKSLVLQCLDYFNCYNTSWMLNVPIFSLYTKYSFSIYFCLLMVLLLVGLYAKSYILIGFSLIELALIIPSI